MLLALEAREGEVYQPADDEWLAIEQGRRKPGAANSCRPMRSRRCCASGAVTVRFTRRARDDLHDILDYLTGRNPAAADRFRQAMLRRSA